MKFLVKRKWVLKGCLKVEGLYEGFSLLPTLAIYWLCTKEDMHQGNSLFSSIFENVVAIHSATKGAVAT